MFGWLTSDRLLVIQPGRRATLRRAQINSGGANFEVLSGNTSLTDGIVKLREYAAVPAIRRYVILESTSIGLTVRVRERSDEAWRVRADARR